MKESIVQQIELFKLMSKEGKAIIGNLNTQYHKYNIQHTVTMISLCRTIKYFDAYILLVEQGYTEPASDLIRSMYHNLIWMRWSLISKENAGIYFNSGEEEMKRMLNRVLQLNIVSIEGAEREEEVLELLEKETKKSGLPPVIDQVRAIGYLDTHFLIYPMLAGISHGSINLIGEDKSYSYLPDGKDIEMFFEVANNVFTDSLRTAEEFIKNGTIRPVPDVLELTGIKKKNK